MDLDRRTLLAGASATGVATVGGYALLTTNKTSNNESNTTSDKTNAGVETIAKAASLNSDQLSQLTYSTDELPGAWELAEEMTSNRVGYRYGHTSSYTENRPDPNVIFDSFVSRETSEQSLQQRVNRYYPIESGFKELKSNLIGDDGEMEVTELDIGDYALSSYMFQAPDNVENSIASVIHDNVWIFIQIRIRDTTVANQRGIDYELTPSMETGTEYLTELHNNYLDIREEIQSDYDNNVSI